MRSIGANRFLAQLGVLAVIAAFFSGCGMTQKIIKTGDPDLIYKHALKLYEDEEWSKASQLFTAVEPYLVGSLQEDSLLFFNARCAFKTSDFETATQKLEEFRRQFGRSAFLEDAEGMYTLSYYYMAPSVTRDQRVTHLAILTIEEFLSRYPNSTQRKTFEMLRGELQSRLYEKSYLSAYTYFKIGRYKSAIVAFKNALKEYPESDLREKIYYYTVASAYELAHNSIYSKKEDRFMQMVDSYYTFIAEYPDSEYRDSVDGMERKARNFLDKQNELRERIAAGEKIEMEQEQELTRSERRTERLEAKEQKKEQNNKE